MTSLRRLVAATASAAALTLVGPLTTASATSYVLRPSFDWTRQFVVTPTGATAASVLDDAVSQPAAPDTGSDYLTADPDSGNWTLLYFPAAEFPAGTTVTSARGWVHLRQDSSRSVRLSLYDNSSWVKLAGFDVPAGSSTGWHAVTLPGPVAPETLSKLTLIVSTSAGQSTSPARLYAAYLELVTPDADSTPVSPVLTPPSPGPAAPAPVSLAVAADRPLEVSATGKVGVPVRCEIALAVCRGTLTLELAPSTRQAVAARRGRRIIARKRFSVAPGKTSKVLVRVSRRGRKLLKRRGKLRVRATIARRGAPTLTSRKTITLRRERHRRSS